jgi:polyisoprenoid-binding protein YceI
LLYSFSARSHKTFRPLRLEQSMFSPLLRKPALAGIASLILVSALTIGCSSGSKPSEQPTSHVETSPVVSPSPEYVNFVPEPRTFRIAPERSEARYEVDEELTFLGIPFNRAIGRTSVVEGQFSFYRDSTDDDKLVLSSGHFEVDLSALTSNDPRRDERIRKQWLESTRFPLAVFEAKEIRGFPGNLSTTEGQVAEWIFELKGEMTIREVTRKETFEVQLILSYDSMEGTASVFLKMKDYGFNPPVIAGLFKVEEGVDVVVEFQADEVLP